MNIVLQDILPIQCVCFKEIFTNDFFVYIAVSYVFVSPFYLKPACHSCFRRVTCVLLALAKDNELTLAERVLVGLSKPFFHLKQSNRVSIFQIIPVCSMVLH